MAQALGHFRFVVTILTGNPKPHSNVFSRSLGQGLPPRSKTARLCFLSSFGCAAGVACSHGLGRLIKINNNNFYSPSHFAADSPSGNTRMFIPWLWATGSRNQPSLVDLWISIIATRSTPLPRRFLNTSFTSMMISR